ncbi:helix-turn-helix transcriptional regulator [Bacillus wiedmannii]|uniref:helix-turn-helix transcriptional regulator n=1 Tax=Bacillus wiedmannii TaxID=1890302 RepID=UPI000BFE3F8B|nr:WYL domain-containing protein [Bacillus wiedmannii]PHE67321.1 WYL domain-containing protein [Bacillus wiedmannii]
MSDKQGQMYRILSMYDRLRNEKSINKQIEAVNFHVSEKTIQRDIDHLRGYIETNMVNGYVEYDRKTNAYNLSSENKNSLTNEKIFAILKVLLESRAFPKNEMYQIIDSLTGLAQTESQGIIKKMTANEKILYGELQHQKDVSSLLWQLAQAIQFKKVIHFQYQREFDQFPHERIVKPVGVIFSEYYFYLVAYQTKYDFDFPTIYRIDRMNALHIKEQHFSIPYSDRFQEGEFRKRVQFMYTGELIKVKFKFKGPSQQAVLDRLPTATIISKDESGILFEAEVFGQGIKMWILSQGEHIEVLEPLEFRNEVMKSLREMLSLYEENEENS